MQKGEETWGRRRGEGLLVGLQGCWAPLGMLGKRSRELSPMGREPGEQRA